MNAESQIESAAGDSAGTALLKGAYDAFRPWTERASDLRSSLARLAEISDNTTARSARKLAHQLAAVEPTITMIGQVKAGKTSLVNAMIGRPGFLPADVNPWTSVITSLHLSPTRGKDDDRASFTFFDSQEWNRLMERGGRMGELAQRAGAEEEVNRVREQIEALREKTKRRLGRKFELLLGQTHDYGYVDSDLVERYVCLGDDFEQDYETSTARGRFADITKSAEIRLHRPELPMPLCVRDTPGVNDTFMMREQITIGAIRDSRTCVVVLSAHQALSSVDMALIRLISNVKAREIVIFVNRIDELSDPTTQIPEIRESIVKTLKDHKGPADAEIIFGSAFWAGLAVSDQLSQLTQASADALVNWGDSQLGERTRSDPLEEIVFELSGLPQLFAALARRVEEGVGREAIDRAAKSAINLASGVSASTDIVAVKSAGHAPAEVDERALMAGFDEIAGSAKGAFDRAFDGVVADFHTRVDRATNSFLDRAVASLLDHLETKGEKKVWSYEPTGLRLLLRSAYTVFAQKAQSVTDAAMAEAVAGLTALYSQTFGLDEGAIRIETAPPPRVPAPVLLGQTIALDIKGNWWRNWWKRRRGYDAYAGDFLEMIRAEIDPVISGLKDSHKDAVRDEARATLERFFAEQRDILGQVAERAREGDSTEGGFAVASAADKKAAIDETLAALTEYAA